MCSCMSGFFYYYSHREYHFYTSFFITINITIIVVVLSSSQILFKPINSVWHKNYTISSFQIFDGSQFYDHHITLSPCTLIVKSIPLEFPQNWFWCIVACAALGKPYSGLDSPFVNQMATHRHTQTITIIIH